MSRAPRPAARARNEPGDRLRIGILGDRGIPARYGGFSTLVEELAPRLVADHRMAVTVYCRRRYYSTRRAAYRGVELIHLPSPGGKHFESLASSCLSVLHSAARRRFDAALLLDPGNAPLVPFLRLTGARVALHTDGLGWRRRKWSAPARAYYRWCERLAARVADRLVTDSLAMRDHYLTAYGADSTYLPYGSRVGDPPWEPYLEELSLEPRGYYLVVARIEPDNNLDLVVREYRASGVDRPLVVVGDAAYPSAFSRAIFALEDESVRRLGGVYESRKLNALYAGAYAYIHGHEVGGTNPALLRAMGWGLPCLVLDAVFNDEVVDDPRSLFARRAGSLAARLRALESDPSRAAEMGRRCAERAARRYRWDAVAAGYATLFQALAGRADREALRHVYRPESFAGPEAGTGG